MFAAVARTAAAKMTGRGHTRSEPISARTPTIPNQPVPGKRTPAAVSGDAHPMMQRGGTQLARTAAGARQRQAVGLALHRSGHGAASNVVARSQRSTPDAVGAPGPRNKAATPIKGQEAAP